MLTEDRLKAIGEALGPGGHHAIYESDLPLYDDACALFDEVERLRAGIRKHRDEKGHDRCWLDDRELYALLPEGTPADQTLPPRDEFLRECERYYELRRAR